MKIFVINGPNLNMLGLREKEHYGTGTYQDLVDMIKAYADKNNVNVEFYQSNHEGDLVDYIQRAYFQKADGIVINPGAYTHTSVALLDAVKSAKVPTVEVHISKVEEREDFRQVSFIRQACVKTITGLGFEGYLRAIDFLKEDVK